MYSNWLLYGIYLFLKGLVKSCLAIYYPDTKVTGRRYLRLQGPTLIATNHPNTLLDALNGAARVNEQVFFLVNASLFRTSIQRWFFETFYCIPIERPQDAGGRPVDNQAAFARCDAHLGRGGHLFIAPEGTSVLERRLRPLKTGAARIAFSAEQQGAFDLQVCILPICLNYERADKLGSRLLINVGAPLLTTDYRARHEQNPRQAALEMTRDLETRMKSLLIITRDETEDRVVRRLEQLLQNSRPVDQPAHFHRTKRLISGLHTWENADKAARQHFEEDLHRYFTDLAAAGTADAAVATAMEGHKQRNGWRLAGLLAGLPLFLYGALNNYLPYAIPRWLYRKLDVYVGYAATVKILGGLVTFPLFYGIQTLLVSRLIPWPWPLIYLFSLLPLGYFAHWYPGFFGSVRRRLGWQRLQRQAPEKAVELVGLRRKLWFTLQGRLLGNPAPFSEKGATKE